MSAESLRSDAATLATQCRRRLSAALGSAARARGGHYVVDPDDNLIGCTSAEIKEEFAAGSGRELAGKIRAPWSSAALCINSFCRWRTEGALSSLELAGQKSFHGLTFEKRYRHGIKGPPPHLDAELVGPDGTVAVESKCLEPVDLSLKQPVIVSSQYRAMTDRNDPRCSSRWYAALDEVTTFWCLDAYQLVKHYLGLAKSGTPGPKTLVYLYWQPLNADHEIFSRHREEVERFASLVATDETCAFVPLTYSRHWDELDALDAKPPWLSAHLNALRRRYEVEI